MRPRSIFVLLFFITLVLAVITMATLRPEKKQVLLTLGVDYIVRSLPPL